MGRAAKDLIYKKLGRTHGPDKETKKNTSNTKPPVGVSTRSFGGKQ